MDDLDRLRQELDQIHEELVQQQQWVAAARERFQADRAELTQTLAESLKTIPERSRPARAIARGGASVGELGHQGHRRLVVQHRLYHQPSSCHLRRSVWS